MSRRAKKVFRATVVEGFGGLIFLLLVGAALPRLVDTRNITAQENASQQVQTTQPAVNAENLPLSANDSQHTVLQPVAKVLSATVQPQAVWGQVGWGRNNRVQTPTRVYLTDRRPASPF